MTATIKLPPPALAVLAIGALWWLSQRRAVAGTLGGTVTGNPQYGRQAGVANGAVQRYNIPPSGVTPATPTPLQTGLSFLASLIPRVSAAPSAGLPTITNPATIDALDRAYSQGGPSTGVYGVAAYQPTYTPDTQGEAAAQAYYLSNPDEFISNPPNLYQYNSGIDPAGGFLDNQ